MCTSVLFLESNPDTNIDKHQHTVQLLLRFGLLLCELQKEHLISTVYSIPVSGQPLCDSFVVADLGRNEWRQTSESSKVPASLGVHCMLHADKLFDFRIVELH